MKGHVPSNSPYIAMNSSAMSAEIREQLLAPRVVPVLRLASAELTERAARCIAATGFMGVEIS